MLTQQRLLISLFSKSHSDSKNSQHRFSSKRGTKVWLPFQLLHWPSRFFDRHQHWYCVLMYNMHSPIYRSNIGLHHYSKLGSVMKECIGIWETRFMMAVIPKLHNWSAHEYVLVQHWCNLCRLNSHEHSGLQIQLIFHLHPHWQRTCELHSFSSYNSIGLALFAQIKLFTFMTLLWNAEPQCLHIWSMQWLWTTYAYRSKIVGFKSKPF